MTDVDLPPRRRLRKLDERADDRGELAELLVAEIFDLEHVGDDGEWYDAVNPRTGAKYQVKSTTVERSSDGDSRFRLWEADHRSLLASDASGTAYYVFVLFGPSGGFAGLERMHPSTVSSILSERGGWNQAGHADKSSRQHKLPYQEVDGL